MSSGSTPQFEPPAPREELDYARSVLKAEAAAISGLVHAAIEDGDGFIKAVGLIVGCASAGGTVLVSGLGKSGLVGAKISATLSSLGIPSHSVHPAEAAHGDLGRFRANDTALCISHSGETDEVVDLAAILRQDGLPIIAITGGGQESPSSLERLATVSLRLGVEEEAGSPTLVAPTSSTTATMALGDALALCAARRRQFTEADFAKRHPGGSLGGLLRPVTDVLRFSAGRNLPVVPDDLPVGDALRSAINGGRRPGALLLVDSDTGRLSGIFTDGDLRRLVLRDPSELARPIREVMTRNPRTLSDTALVRDAVRMVREHRADEIPVVDSDHRPVGLLDVQDLVAMKLVKD
ncbi:MAG: KpsF/GutQ family sugar-phosphate isomerase [Phycisphaeraceae bacterium]|nr:MAG: KpsF/GutQ family sugar-phosphate isomerase [Phycisphaeraceae bacterium]